MSEKTHIYFASDFHLGAPNHLKSLEREKRIVQWLNSIKHNAKSIYLVGDLFDFWFEYKHAIPKGFTRFLGKIAELSDSGIDIHFFTGNHDMWMYDYFEKELGVKIHRKPIELNLNGKQFYIGHGDGLGPGDKTFKLVKRFFDSSFCQWLFARLHPNFGIGIAQFWSRKSRQNNKEPKEFLGEEKEWLVAYCKDVLTQKHIDYFVFGHRHLPIEHKIDDSTYINLGDWLSDYTYAIFDGEKLALKRFSNS